MATKEKTIDQEQYKWRVQRKKPKPAVLRNTIMAFLVGGLICTLGQGVLVFFQSLGMSMKEAAGPTASVMVFLGAFLTGLGVYDDIGKVAGAGSVVPITGFANSMVSPAMEFKREGFVTGVGARMFQVAGPVLVYSTVTSIMIGIVYWLTRLWEARL